MQKLKRLLIGIVAAVITLSVGIGVASYLKQRLRAKRCAQASYFPNGVLPNDIRSEWMGKYYAAQLEQPFTCFGDDAEVYRLLYIPAFEYPTSIRIWRDGNQYQMAIKQLSQDMAPQATAKDLIVNVTRSITVEEWTKFRELLDKANYWSMPSPDVREPGLDGMSFLLEAKKDGKYHVVYRWVPEDENFLALCGYLVEITKLKWNYQQRTQGELIYDERFFSQGVMLPTGEVTHAERESFAHELETAINGNTGFTEIDIRAEAPEKDVIALYAQGVTKERCLALLQSTVIQRAAESGFRTLSCQDKKLNYLYSTPIKNPKGEIRLRM
ncbi:MAG TPA: hypothetical protein VJT15_10395 [Pyrinomonadaceae bacterium]|nr:hypothetical protein [Pyrinomonadaceae bacterium]